MINRERFLRDKARAADLNKAVKQAYPNYADEARTVMNNVLRRADHELYLVFNGEAIDKTFYLGELSTTHRYIASLLECRDKGQPVSPQYLTHTVRACLGLGFDVIQGDKAK